MNGRTILRDPAEGVVAGPRFTCARAFTDNDRWLRDGHQFYEDRRAHGFFSEGLSQLRYHAFPIVVDGGTVRTEVEVTGAKSAGFMHVAEWTFGADGSVTVNNRIVPRGTMPQTLPRIGLSLKLDKALERMKWYGRGPLENYIDRCTGSFLGVWHSTVTEQYVDYIRPQDCGYKSDVRWVEFRAEDGRGVRFTSAEPMFVQALHYDCDDLDFARHRAGQKRHRVPLMPVEEVRLNLDCRQLGLGGGSCGPATLPKYRFDVRETSWNVRMEPVSGE
jgi:beta-galactosidase